VPAETELSSSAERLLGTHIDSVGALDLLLALHDEPRREWTLAEICETLRCPEAWAGEQLERFRAAGLCAPAGSSSERFRYTDGKWGRAVEELARVYRHDRAAVTRFVFAQPAAHPRSTGPRGPVNPKRARPRA
jgi:hypothetical protein